jgi:DNA-binding NarL/FixJ family response regulator
LSKRTGRVLLVEDYECVAYALAAVLSEHGLTVERPTGFARTAVLAKAKEFRPDVVLLDFWLGKRDSLSLIEPLASLGCRVAMFTAMDNPVVLGECFDRGAVGNISKLQRIEDLVRAIDDAMAGRDLVSSDKRDEFIAQALANRELEGGRSDPFGDLTPREDEVLRLMISGHRAIDIARREFIAMSTVRTHIRGVLNKLGVGSQVEAVGLAHKHGWPPATPMPSDRWAVGRTRPAQEERTSRSKDG